MLYFGCNVVLAFDGERWTKYPVPGSYAIRGLAFGSDGRLWVAAINDGGDISTGRGRDSRFTTPLSKSSRRRPTEPGDVWQVIARGDGAVFLTSTSVLVWDGSSFKVNNLPGGRRLGAVQTAGRIFVSQRTTGVWSLEDNGLKQFISPEASSIGRPPLDAEADAKGWTLATTDSLCRFENGKLTEIRSEATVSFERMC